MTSTAEDSGEIFKRDRMGRVRVPRARREMLLDEWERSGGSAAQFADYVGVKYSPLGRRARQCILAESSSTLLCLWTGLSLPVALHPASQRRSYLQLRTGQCSRPEG